MKLTDEMRERLRELELVSDIDDTRIVELRAGGAKLADADRKALLERVRGGEHVELEFEARTYIQRETPNRNFVRFKPSILKRLARSFVGVPFLRDHDKRSLTARGGTIVASELVQDTDGDAFHQTIRVVKPWAAEGLLDGTIDRFSIGAAPTGDIICSAHKTPIFTKCFCFPGDKVGDSDERVEFVITAAEGVETSAVNVPAVVGTGIKGVRAALEALAASAGGIVPPASPTEGTKMETLLVLLGLTTGASEAAAVAKLEVILAELKTAREAVGGIAQLQAELDVLRASQVDHHIERLYAEGRLPIKRDGKGDRVAGELETKLRNLAKVVSLKAMLEVAESLPVVAPIGPRSLETALGVAGGPAPEANVAAAPITADNAITQYARVNNIRPEVLAATMAECGLDGEALAKHGPRRGGV